MIKKSLHWLSLSLIVMSIWSLGPVAAGSQGNGGPAVWVPLGPRGGMAQALALSPDFVNDGLVLAGEHRTLHHPLLQYGVGIRRSTDGGLSWNPTALAPPNAALSSTLSIHDLAFSPAFATDETVFAATWSGVFRSTDGGESWHTVPGEPDMLITSVAVAPDFATSGHLMAGYGYGMASLLYVSEDGGQSWTEHHGVNARADIAYSPHFADDGTALTAGDGIYLTTNRGISWTQVLTHVTYALAVSPQFVTDGTLFAGGVDVVHVSTNGGAGWISHTVTADTTWILALALSPAFATDDTLFAGTLQGLYRSTDRGQHWTAVASYPGPDAYAVALAPTWPTMPTLLVGSSSGVHRSDDGGSTWYQGEGLAPLRVTRLVQGPDPLRLTAATARHGVYQSHDDGATWRFAGLDRSTGISNIALSPDYLHDQTMLAAVPAGAGMGFSRTVDGGATWEWLSSTDYPGGGLAFSPTFPADPFVFATGQHGKVLRSTDLGETWEPVGAPPTGTYSLDAWHVALPPAYPADGTLFAAGAGFWRLPHGAEAWQLAATALLTETQVTSLAVSPDYELDQALMATAQRMLPDLSTSSGVYRSTDGGVTWERLTSGLPPADTATPPQRVIYSPDYAADRTIYAQTKEQLYRSTDGGDHWTLINVPPDAVSLWDVAGGMQGRIYIAGDTGVWRYTTLTRRLYIPLMLR
jgi:photosystem II stability/assembly factor-like uncharacterized protein